MQQNFLSQLTGLLDNQTVGNLSNKLGASPKQTQDAISGALPLLLGALSKNASKPEGAQALHKAIQKDHSSVDLASLLSGITGGSGGQNILKHVLGGKQQVAAAAVGQSSGLNSQQSGDLLAMLAPMLMGALGQKASRENLSADSLSTMLGGERAQLQKQGGAASGLLSSVLDQDGDGDVDVNDVLSMGKGLLGSFLKR